MFNGTQFEPFIGKLKPLMGHLIKSKKEKDLNSIWRKFYIYIYMSNHVKLKHV